MSTSDSYQVQLSSFAETHYVKAFAKRYKGKQWDFTLSSIYLELARIEEFLKTDKAETIHVAGNQLIIKQYFRIVQTKDSAKASGYRLIAHVDKDKKIVNILLVYSKNEICAPNETSKWREVVKDNHKDVAEIFQLHN